MFAHLEGERMFRPSKYAPTLLTYFRRSNALLSWRWDPHSIFTQFYANGN